jgi:deoxycytidylate deaminase
MTGTYGRILVGTEGRKARGYFANAAAVAQQATCLRARCGTVIVSHDKIIGTGYNGPPRNLADRATCSCDGFVSADKPLYDRTCCVHAEWRAILEAAKRAPDSLDGSQLYFMRLDGDGSMTFAGDPYCTVCSRLALEAGIAEILLWQKRGIVAISSSDYDRLSYAYYSPVNA